MVILRATERIAELMSDHREMRTLAILIRIYIKIN